MNRFRTQYIYYIAIIEKSVIVDQLLHMPVPLSMENFGELPCFQYQKDLFYQDKGENWAKDF